MSDLDLERTQSTNPPDSQSSLADHSSASETQSESEETIRVSRTPLASPVPSVAPDKPAENASATAATSRKERAGTVEHLAARRSFPELDAETSEIKQRLGELRTEITQLLSSLRFENLPVNEAAERLVPLLNVGPVQQWKGILIPFLLEIDRSGNLIPVWMHIIENGDPKDLPPDANPAETMEGRARRFAVLMLGNYKTVTIVSKQPIGFAKIAGASSNKVIDVTKILGQLVLDPGTSLYASQALVKLGVVSAWQTLIGALGEAEGWAKVDIVEACMSLEQERFYDLLLASGFEHANGLESYIAIPIYRTVPLENYLQKNDHVEAFLAQQAALIAARVWQEGVNPPTGKDKELPAAFERELSPIATALFDTARSNPSWQYALALHRLATLLGRYWGAISRREIQDSHIIEPVYKCLPMMNEVERWMAGPGRDALLSGLETTTNADETLAITKVLGELKESRVASPLLARLEEVQEVQSRSEALAVGAMCDALGQIGDRRAVPVLSQIVLRVVDTPRRSSQLKRRDNLPSGHADIPVSIVYASVIRASGLLGDTSALDLIFTALNDFDPYVRAQALEALQRLDPTGSDMRSRPAVRDALRDPRESVVRSAGQVIARYRDHEAVPLLHSTIEDRPEVAATLYDVLRQIG